MSIEKATLRTYQQKDAYTSPWTTSEKVRMLLWAVAWRLMCSWTPKPMNAWRLMWLKLFGVTIYGQPFVHQRAKITIPWHLTMHDRACLGDGAVAYSLGEIELMQNCTVAQEAYLCTGTHDFSLSTRPLQTGKIVIGRSAFIGARAFVMPNIKIGDGAIVGACSVVTKDVTENSCVVGNPATALIKNRRITSELI
jgi:putative colanic acid biosynthesis acetyltransferase WcaF